MIDGERFKAHSTKAPYAIGRHKLYPEVLRFEVRPGENGGNEAVADKVELQQVRRSRYSDTKIIQHSWAILIPRGQIFPTYPQMKGEDWFILGQWHATEDAPGLGRIQDDSLSPPIAYDFSGGDFKLITRSDDHELQLTSRYPVKNIRYVYKNFSRDKWVVFSENLKFGWRGGAVMTLRIDGHLVFKTPKVQSIGYNDIFMPHFNFGIYRNGGFSSSSVVLYADHRFSSQRRLKAKSLPSLSLLCNGGRNG